MLRKVLTMSAVVALMTIGSIAREHHGGNGHHSRNHHQEIRVELSDSQKEGLIFMIEEEKIARDVYLHLFKTWNLTIFSNIAKAEQKHIDAVHRLLIDYDLKTPSTLNIEGKFENPELQSLYNDLITKGDISLIDSLEVGILIEKKDINDLQELLNEEIPRNVERIYGNLIGGSFNHLNAFNRELSQ